MKELEIFIKEIVIHNPSEKGEMELDLELVFDNLTSLGRIQLPRITGEKIARIFAIPFGTTLDTNRRYYPLVANNKFPVAFHAIERDGPQWLDPDDRAHGEITIDLDTNGGPPSTWSVIAGAKDTDLKIEIKFDMLYLKYVRDPREDDSIGSNYPWGETTVFQHTLGLGQHGVLRPDPSKLYRSWKMYNFATKRFYTSNIYRFSREDWNLPEDSISSIYLNSHSITLYEHHYSDSRFANCQRVSLRNPGLYNLPEMNDKNGWNWNDRVSAIEMVVNEYPSSPVH